MEHGLKTPKTPACILFNQKKEFSKFGYDAVMKYKSLPSSEADKWYFFQNFKMRLYNTHCVYHDCDISIMFWMFTEHPDTKSYFTHFKGMDSAEEMKQSDQVRGHGKRVFTAINDMVQHLDNTEAFLGILNPLGQKHATQLKVDPKNFRIICDIILQLMEEKFGGDCKASFEKVTNEICTHLNNVYKEAGCSATRQTRSSTCLHLTHTVSLPPANGSNRLRHSLHWRPELPQF
ncbi:Cytoglobin-1-like protein [Aix galericulata]|nr:Cytoglobin-1-like protein [Aix galericulata]